MRNCVDILYSLLLGRVPGLEVLPPSLSGHWKERYCPFWVAGAFEQTWNLCEAMKKAQQNCVVLTNATELELTNDPC